VLAVNRPVNFIKSDVSKSAIRMKSSISAINLPSYFISSNLVGLDSDILTKRFSDTLQQLFSHICSTGIPINFFWPTYLAILLFLK